jgi:hypothetical protein
VSSAKIAALAILPSHLSLSCVEEDAIADDAVTTDKIEALAVTAAKIAIGTITYTQLANSTITVGKMASNSVDAAQIVDGCITPEKLQHATSAGDILVADNTADHVFKKRTLSGDATISYNGTLTLAAKGVSVLSEQATLNTAAGASTSTTTHVRGSVANVPFVKVSDLQSNVTSITTTGKIYMAVGTYVFEGSAPCYGGGLHKTSLQLYTAGDATSGAAIDGTSETAPTSYQNRSHVAGVVVVPTGYYIKLLHYVTTAVATNGLGLPVNTGSTENYAQLKLTRIA